VPALADLKFLALRIQMMELESADPTPIATQDTRAARLLNKLLLHPPPSLDHSS
jgi:hypothetical protein